LERGTDDEAWTIFGRADRRDFAGAGSRGEDGSNNGTERKAMNRAKDALLKLGRIKVLYIDGKDHVKIAGHVREKEEKCPKTPVAPLNGTDGTTPYRCPGCLVAWTISVAR
jgi:hypothetical protein